VCPQIWDAVSGRTKSIMRAHDCDWMTGCLCGWVPKPKRVMRKPRPAVHAHMALSTLALPRGLSWSRDRAVPP
jgi:hypothetical protein